jgi:hypothetical protein
MLELNLFCGATASQASKEQRALEQTMLINPNIIRWAKETLIRAGAARRCPAHGEIQAVEDDTAVRRAVLLVRMNPFEDLSPNASELALLETYLSLSQNCQKCTSSTISSLRSFKLK